MSMQGKTQEEARERLAEQYCKLKWRNAIAGTGLRCSQSWAIF